MRGLNQGSGSGSGSWPQPPGHAPDAAPALTQESGSAPLARLVHEAMAQVAAVAEACAARGEGACGHAGAEAAAPALGRVSPRSGPPSPGTLSPGTQTPPEDAPDAPLDAIELVPACVVLAAAARRRSAVIDEAAHARRASGPSHSSGPSPSPSPSPSGSPERPMRGRFSPVSAAGRGCKSRRRPPAFRSGGHCWQQRTHWVWLLGIAAGAAQGASCSSHGHRPLQMRPTHTQRQKHAPVLLRTPRRQPWRPA